ncbi:MAG: hypothetical protein ACOZIN_09725 [Myxococcota bacterium]
MRHTLLTVCVLSAAGPAFADADWFASLYTQEGVELRADERVFTLYALFNVMGYDAAPVVRKDPVPKYDFHPVRAAVRAQLAAADAEVRRQAEQFFDSHPQPLDKYLAYVVNSAPPPFTTGAKSKELSDLKGLEALLAKAHHSWKLGELMAQTQSDYRRALKAYLRTLDVPLSKARKLLKAPEEGLESLLVVNLLEAQGVTRGVMGDREVVLVVGPSDKPDLEGVLREYARVLLEPKVSKKAQTSWAGGAALLREARLVGASERTVGEYAAALLSRALALRALDAADAVYEAATQQGYFGLKDIAKSFDDSRAVDAWALEALAKAETRRPAKK